MFDRQRSARSARLSPSTDDLSTASAKGAVLIPQQLRQLRHAGLFQAVQRLDTAGLDELARSELAAWVKEQYAGTYGSVPVGFVAACHLGPPYVDHYLNLMLSIVDHYARGDAMPSPFDQARMLARNGAYAFVEVHDNGLLIPIRPDGTPVV